MQLSSFFTRYADNNTYIEVKGNTIGECLHNLVRQYPKLAKVLLNKDGNLFNIYDIFINGESAYPDEMTKPVKDGDKLYIVPIIHGG
jgi:molybdopterin converting factor small subunit